MDELNKLFEPIQIGQMALKNRIVMPAMGTRLSIENGHVSQRQIDYYEARAKGGVGLIITEITAPYYPGRNRVTEMAISDDSYIPGFSRLAEAVHKHGARIAVQLHHAGSDVYSDSTGYSPVGPSALITSSGKTLHMLDTDEIEEIVNEFAAGAKRAKEAGIDGVEIHGAHHYLIAAFISGFTNKRTDRYGGSIHNRARFLVEIIQAVRGTVGNDYPVWVRINGMEFDVENGVTTEEAQQVAKMAVYAGAQAIHVSAFGANADSSKAPIPHIAGSLLPLAEEIKKVVNVPVIGVGRLDPEIAEHALEEGKVDLVAFGRRLIADPELPEKAAEGRLQDVVPCIGCMECLQRHVFASADLSCTVNVTTGREREYKIQPTENVKTVVVIGGGPSGMEAARVAALRGHKVVLYEKENKLGGLLNLAAKPPNKQDILPLVSYMSTQLQKTGVGIKLSTEATTELVTEHRPDVVIVATGGIPVIPEFAATSGRNVVTAEEVLSGKIRVGQNVVVIGGGMVGCETGHLLSHEGKKVTIIEISEKIAEDMVPISRSQLISKLKEKHVAIFTDTNCKKIEKDSVTVIINNNQEKIIPADTVVLAVGYKANNALFKALEGKVPSVHCIGDASEPRHIMDAILDGYNVGQSL